MSYSILKIKSVPFYNSEIVLDDPIVDNYIESTSNNVEIRFNTHNISTPDRLAIDRWHTNIFSPTFKSIIDHADAEIIEYDNNSKNIKLTVSASVFPTYVDCDTIIFNARLFNIKITEPTAKYDNISWDEYFMSVAKLTSMRSKDMNTKVGAVLVDSKNRIIGTGYNGLPSHIDESKFPTSNNKSLPYNETKYAYVAHAELNSILNTTVYDLTNSKIYCTLFPCNECAKVIIQKGISEIIYLSDKYHNDSIYIASRKLLDSAGIPYRQYAGNIYVNKI